MAFVIATLLRGTRWTRWTRGWSIWSAGKKEKQLLEQLLAEKDKHCSEKNGAGKKKKQLLAEKDKRIERLTCDVEDLNRECVEKVARYCAVLANRIVVDEGLRRLYPRLNTFVSTPKHVCIHA